mmetsp:Transcript_7826/g.11816  ORF Transcript_7826/g.11816 Transcript_7826/m.11816 type:complete len:301 (+) Transcript_7826:134-1036(+)
MANARGGGYGLDAELAAKQAAQYDYEGEKITQKWIETLIGREFEADYATSLKDGTKLCEVINVIKPGRIKINKMKMPFMQMENISNFLKNCRTLGVAEHSLFETVDLYEAKDVNLVIRCLFALGTAIQASVPDFKGPHLGAKPHHVNRRSFTQEQIKRARQEAAIIKQSAGSSAVMESLPILETGITRGAKHAGIGDSNAYCMAGMGSYGIMDKPNLTKTGITMGADMSGPSVDHSVPQGSLGSSTVMERVHISKQGITTGADHSGPSVSSNMYVSKSSPYKGLRKEIQKELEGEDGDDK